MKMEKRDRVKKRLNGLKNPTCLRKARNEAPKAFCFEKKNIYKSN